MLFPFALPLIGPEITGAQPPPYPVDPVYGISDPVIKLPDCTNWIPIVSIGTEALSLISKFQSPLTAKDEVVEVGFCLLGAPQPTTTAMINDTPTRFTNIGIPFLNGLGAPSNSHVL
jgi:hypothetical protein